MKKKRLLLTGGTGFVGAHLISQVNSDLWDFHATYFLNGPPRTCCNAQMQNLDITDKKAVDQIVKDLRPDVIIHAAAIANSTACYHHPERAWKVNVDGTRHLCQAAAQQGGVKMFFISTDLVFDGENAPYSEVASTNPLSVYGKTKQAAERVVSHSLADACIVRLPLLYGQAMGQSKSFASTIFDALKHRRSIRLFADEYRTPIHVANACQLILALARLDHPPSVCHFGGPDRMSRLDFARRLARAMNLPAKLSELLLIPISQKADPAAEPRPYDCSLVNENLPDSMKNHIWSTDAALLRWKHEAQMELSRARRSSDVCRLGTFNFESSTEY